MPDGVPVRMIVPAGSVVPWDNQLTSAGMLNIKSLNMLMVNNADEVEEKLERNSGAYLSGESCITLLFLSPRMRSLLGSGITEVETIVGPIGQDVSKPLLKHHCDCSNWLFRAEMSFDAVYPRT
jgi:hypothetical protein